MNAEIGLTTCGGLCNRAATTIAEWTRAVSSPREEKFMLMVTSS